jgi:hypothetical protein
MPLSLNVAGALRDTLSFKKVRARCELAEEKVDAASDRRTVFREPWRLGRERTTWIASVAVEPLDKAGGWVLGTGKRRGGIPAGQ